MAGFGETLYQARANMGVTLKEAEQATRISRHHLAALEEENFSALPPLTYQRGIVRNYANYLRLDPGKLLVIFEEAHGGSGQHPSGLDQRPPVNMPGHWTPNFAVISFAVVLSAIVFAWVYSAFVAQPDTISMPTEPVPTATPFESDIPVPTKAPTQVPATTEPTAEPNANTTTDNGSTQPGDSNQRGGDNVRDDTTDAQATQDPSQSQRTGDTILAVTEEPAETPTLVPTSAFDESELTSISISATADLWVTVWADDQVVFDGNLGSGQSTGHLIGNTFEVYTSIGGQTVFTNACGEEYLMGYETSEANYTLKKAADSCAPVRD
jgi:cytoskeletal protein RodZ